MAGGSQALDGLPVMGDNRNQDQGSDPTPGQPFRLTGYLPVVVHTITFGADWRRAAAPFANKKAGAQRLRLWITLDF